ncbi:MAG: hypothetical protein F4164_00565 [Gemmatimonadales bacterium]|nr:hypothetical protein [Gemmatimonadales bacterium]
MPGALPRASGATGVAVLIGLALGLTPGSAQGAAPPHALLLHLLQEEVVDTREGGRILVRNPAPGRGGGPEEWRLVEELRLGEVDGAGPEVFGNVHDVAVDEKGHIYVLDYGSKEVRVFDREGRHLRNMARNGEGPGEFRYSEWGAGMRIIWQSPNRLWIGDRWQQLSFDSLGNELSRSGQAFGPGFRAAASMFDGEVLAQGRVVAADAAGFVYQEISVFAAESAEVSVNHTYGVRLPVFPEHPDPPRDSLLLDRRVTTSTRQPTQEGGGVLQVGGIIRSSVPRRVWGFGQGGTAWLADRAVHRFHEVTFSGDTVRTVELGNPPPPPPDDSDESKYRPRIADLEVSPEGWLWVRRHQEDLAEDPAWDLFDNCGLYRGEVSTSTRLGTPRHGSSEPDPMDLGPGGMVHGIARDALHVSYVLRLRLESATGARVFRETCSS